MKNVAMTSPVRHPALTRPTLGKLVKAAGACGLLALLIACPAPAMAGITNALTAWWHTLVPGLFPFFIAAELAVSSGALGLIALPLRPLAKLMRCPAEAAGAFALSLFAGYPSGARLTGELYREGKLTREQACYLAAFAGGTGPGIFASVGVGMYGDPGFGWILWVAMALAALYTGWFFTLVPLRARGNAPAAAPPREEQSYRLTAVIGRSVTAILAVGGCMAAFAALAAIAQSLGLVTRLAGLLAGILPGELTEGLLFGALEMTTGLSIAAAAAPSPLAGAVLAGIISFGGAAVIAQIAGALEPIRFPWGRLLATRLVQALLGGLFAYLFLAMSFLPWAIGLALIPVAAAVLRRGRT